tara:strand:+ start:202 stop:360 length:159 start_codon:yes stop_codon:yes gene_type:complete
MQSDASCEDVDNYPRNEEYLSAILTTINELRHMSKPGDFARAIGDPIKTTKK